MTVIPELRREH